MAHTRRDATPLVKGLRARQLPLPLGDNDETRPPGTREKVYREGFRVRVVENGVLIEALDYHTRPLFLQEEALAELGLRIERDDT